MLAYGLYLKNTPPPAQLLIGQWMRPVSNFGFMTGSVSQQSYEGFSYNYLPLLLSPSFFFSYYYTTSFTSPCCVDLPKSCPSIPTYRSWSDKGATYLVASPSPLSSPLLFLFSISDGDVRIDCDCFYFVNCLIISFRHFFENFHTDQDGRLSSTQEPGPPALVLEQIGQAGGSY